MLGTDHRLGTEAIITDKRKKPGVTLQVFKDTARLSASLCGDGFHRTLILARSTVCALFGVDHVGFFPFADRVLRTDFGTSTTRDAFIRIDYTRHPSLLANGMMCLASNLTAE
jgi:hypothetical protein